MRMRKKPNLEPRMQRCAEYLVTAPMERKGQWRNQQTEVSSLYLELGCGKGRFTCGTAATLTDTLLVAIERVPDAMIIAMERATAAALHNVLFVDGDVAKLNELFAPGEADRIYINFCDPWPSNRHAKRRLTHRNFLLLYRDILAECGEIHFKTDNRALFEWSLCQFPKAGYELREVSRDLHEHGICGIMTDYEDKFHQLGTKINRCVAVKQVLPIESVHLG